MFSSEVWLSFFCTVVKMQYLILEQHTHTHTQVLCCVMFVTHDSRKPITHRPAGRYRRDREITELKCPLPWPAKVEGDNYICPSCFHSNIPLALLFLFYISIFLGGGGWLWAARSHSALHPVITAGTFFPLMIRGLRWREGEELILFIWNWGVTSCHVTTRHVTTMWLYLNLSYKFLDVSAPVIVG